jgi:hypothetical protein
VPGHVDRGAEEAGVVVEVGDGTTLRRAPQRRGQRAADVVQLAREHRPIERVHRVRGRHAASIASRARLAAIPPRYPPMVPSLRTTR